MTYQIINKKVSRKTKSLKRFNRQNPNNTIIKLLKSFLVKKEFRTLIKNVLIKNHKNHKIFMINTIYLESPILFKDKKIALEFKKILIWETLGKQKHCK